MRRLALLLVAACGTSPDATTPQKLVFDAYSVPQYTSYDMFVGGSGNVVIMSGRISRDGGATWARFNDDAHQYGGIGNLAGDWNTYGRIYFGVTTRGVLYTN